VACLGAVGALNARSSHELLLSPLVRPQKGEDSWLSSKSTNQPKDSLPEAVISGADPCWIRHLSRVRPVAVTLLLSQEESLTVDGRFGKASAATSLETFLALLVGETDRVEVASSCLLLSRQLS